MQDQPKKLLGVLGPNFNIDKRFIDSYTKCMSSNFPLPTINLPTLHQPIPMETRVRVPKHYLGHEAVRTVVGISFMHVIFSYIVLLDEPISSGYGIQRATCVGGAELTSEDGLTNWRNPV